MAGMFYSLQEVASKLNKTEDEIKELVQQGKLREFRDGPNLLFKVNEVEVLMSMESPAEPAEAGVVEPSEEAVIDLGEETSVSPPVEAEAVEEPVIEPVEESAEEVVAEPVEGLDSGEIEALIEEPSVKPESSALELEPLGAESEEGVSLEPEQTGGSDAEISLGAGDTSIASEGISVLGETDGDYKISDDTMGETKAAGSESSLEEIEGDVNLDTFGSGSGLLDLSLQADDTSLGGILDEIYTEEGEGDQAQPAASAAEMAAEAEEIISEETISAPESIMEMPVVAAAGVYAEAAPDKSSNLLGFMLILPLLAVIYTAAVVVSALMGGRPMILMSIKGLIIPILGGLLVVALVLSVVGFMSTSTGAKAAKKAKPKKEKKKKEKKPKEKKKKKEIKIGQN